MLDSIRFPGFLLLFLLTDTALAGELVHSFINTDFGGNPLTSSYLLSNASAQNGHKAQVTPTSTTSTSASSSTSTALTSGEVFAQQLDRLVINALANRLVDKAVNGGASIGVKTFNTGLNQVTIDDTGTATQITITDNKTGGKTVVELPNY
jgi:hypothetical protein